jgi:hypothetical protein
MSGDARTDSRSSLPRSLRATVCSMTDSSVNNSVPSRSGHVEARIEPSDDPHSCRSASSCGSPTTGGRPSWRRRSNSGLRRNLVKLAYAYFQNSRHRVKREGSRILIRRKPSRIDRRADGYPARVIRRSGESVAIGMQEPQTPAEFNYFKKKLRVNRDGNVRSRNRQFFAESGQ